ncbi:hypothetical protein CD58_09765 [Pseudomonas brassicacearum]|nr:hypothetical protein CD58_09765 [Pseudomonas brassicacearum]
MSGRFFCPGFVAPVLASSRASSLPQFDRVHPVGASLLAMAICQAPPMTEACAVRSSCRLPLNNTRVAINPSTAAPLSHIPGAALLSSTWIR